MSERNIRIIFILDYGNALYDGGHSPYTDEGRAAFARFAAAAVRRYRGRGMIWELWNEPNLAQFWYPTPNATHYARLALAAANAIRSADPTAIITGPAMVGFEWPFWHTVGQLGVFKKLDAVSVHPYGVDRPEDVLLRYRQLRRVIDRYSPDWTLPMIISESGFSSVKGGIGAEVQAHYLARTWLLNLAHDVPLTIWYDWRNDGIDPAEVEQNFGIVTYDFEPKPAYYAARTLLETLDKYRYLRRVSLTQIPGGSEQDYVLLFQRESSLALAAWTITNTHTITLPLPGVTADVVDVKGNTEVLAAGRTGMVLKLTSAPQYLRLEDNEILQQLGGWHPYTTFNQVYTKTEAQANIRVVVDNPLLQPRYATLELRVAEEARGSLAIVVPPKSQSQFRVPVNMEGLTGDVPAELVFIPAALSDKTSLSFILESPSQLPLQRASLWLFINR